MIGRRFVVGAAGLAFGSFLLLAASCGNSSSATEATGDATADTTVDSGPVPDAASAAIGPSGGNVAMNGVSIAVPAGALASTVTITITRDSSPPPGGYSALSPLYRFAPDGLTFAAPATVTFNVDNPSPLARVQWSNPTSGGYDALATTWSGDQASAQVSHFSSGFVGFADDDGGEVDGGTVLEPSNLSSSSCDTLATSDLHVTANQTIDTGVDVSCDVIITGVTPEICVIRRNVITVDANITLTGVGTRALALIGTTSVTINGVVDVSAVLAQSGAGAPDPRGQGGALVDIVTSGAGGGYGTYGGAAGGPFGTCDAGCGSPIHLSDGGLLQGFPGAPYGTPTCIPLVGGASGSSPYDHYPDGGVAGGGGGALEVVSCRALTVGSQGLILAGGGGGLGGNGGDSNGQCGGGGGSGGTILLEGLSVSLSATASVIANGGGGGGGGGSNGMMLDIFANGNPGADGSKDAGPAPGGAQIIPGSHTPGLAGANGGAEGVDPGSGNGLGAAVTGGCGGAGGAVGRVRINVPAGNSPSVAGAIFSPLFTAGATSMH